MSLTPRLALALLLMSPAGTAADSPQELHQRLVASSAWILAGREGHGTGWIVDGQRHWIVTCYHVVGDATSVDVLFPRWQQGRILDEREEMLAHRGEWRVVGRVVKRDADRDLALIELPELPATARAIPLASQPAAPGDRVQLVGQRADFGMLWSHTAGHVRQSFRAEDGYAWRTARLARGAQLLALQLPINDGDSGGPVANSRGELVGVIAAILHPAQRSAAAIEVREVRRFLGPAFDIKDPGPGHLDRFRDWIKACALVQSPSSPGRATAFAIDRERRLLLTAADAVGPHERVELISPQFDRGQLVTEANRYANAPRQRAAILARDGRRNLALLEAESLPGPCNALKLAGESPRPGEAVHAIGNPTGIDALWLYSAHSVRQLGRLQLSPHKSDGLAATIVLQGPTGDGGPLIDDSGSVVGVIVAKNGPEPQVSYAVAPSEIRSFLDESMPRWNPKTAAELHQRGKMRSRHRRYDDALADFTTALRRDPAFQPVLLDLPELHRLRGRLQDALAAWERAAPLVSPRDMPVLLATRAAIRLDQQRASAAREDCDAAIRLDPKCASALAIRAAVRLAQNDLEPALADADDAVWLDAHLGAAYLIRGRIQFQRRAYDRALTDLTRAIELDPFDPEPLRWRARTFDEKTPPDPKKAQRDRDAAEKLKS